MVSRNLILGRGRDPDRLTGKKQFMGFKYKGGCDCKGGCAAAMHPFA